MKKFAAIVISILVFSFSFISASAASSLPSYFNSVDYGYVTEPKQQGQTSCCWAFSAISCLETDAIMKGYETKDSVDFSEAHLVWATFSSSNIKNDINNKEHSTPYNGSVYKNGGNGWEAVTTVVKGAGLTNEKDYPFYPYNINKMGNYSASDYFKNNGYTIESVVELSEKTEIKEWIKEHGSVSAAIYSSKPLNYKRTEGYSYYSSSQFKDIDHAITIVGWDDNYSKNNFAVTPSSDGAWLCKNSWGTGWGDNGYFWLSYSEQSIDLVFGLSIKKINYNNIYTYNGASFSSTVLINDEFNYSNIYYIHDDEILEGISFISFNPNVPITIKVYELNDNYESPIDGTEIYQTSFINEASGYHIINIDNSNELQLNAGKHYSVTVSVVDEVCIVAVENKNDSHFSYTSVPGQSFYSYSGTYWKDATEKCGNFYVNIFTSNPVSYKEDNASVSPVSVDNNSDNSNNEVSDNVNEESLETDTEVEVIDNVAESNVETDSLFDTVFAVFSAIIEFFALAFAQIGKIF